MMMKKLISQRLKSLFCRRQQYKWRQTGGKEEQQNDTPHNKKLQEWWKTPTKHRKQHQSQSKKKSQEEQEPQDYVTLEDVNLVTQMDPSDMQQRQKTWEKIETMKCKDYFENQNRENNTI